ncbi:hypothetical protein JTE90_010673 [Oedothorax gibbosus]|uniref:Uncharacterized protein n=1 Tax=Oedothorax gibbosus TaxID=931172 RepID=A0AAV6URF3_9ARAC|nr:hypothetical protein JTE90_010673 [Oedothorax gibbosus]
MAVESFPVITGMARPDKWIHPSSLEDVMTVFPDGGKGNCITWGGCNWFFHGNVKTAINNRSDSVQSDIINLSQHPSKGVEHSSIEIFMGALADPLTPLAPSLISHLHNFFSHHSIKDGRKEEKLFILDSTKNVLLTKSKSKDKTTNDLTIHALSPSPSLVTYTISSHTTRSKTAEKKKNDPSLTQPRMCYL